MTVAKLILRFKQAIIKEIPLDKAVTTIGRAPVNDIVIDNLVVSGAHAKVVKEQGRYFIEDLNSTNGTFIGDRRIARQALHHNLVVTVGKHTLQFVEPLAQAEDADATISIRKPISTEATVMIDSRKLRPAPPPTAAAATQSVMAAPAPQGERVGGFTVVEGTTEKVEYELSKRLTTIGKADTAEIKLKGFFAPKIAALVNRTREGYYLSPAQGEKRPLVNGQAVEEAYLLKNLDLVEVGNLKLQFFWKE